MKKQKMQIAAILVAASTIISTQAFGAPEIGKPAPAFTAVGDDGKNHSLADNKGKVVVLEWYNEGCPYVKKHYNDGHMQALQKEYKDKGVVWYSVVSSKPGSQGALANPAEALKHKNKSKATSSTILLDPKGTMGKAYDAKTTPHMFIIGTNGNLVYKGAIDDQPSASKKSLVGAKNHVRAALDEVLALKPVSLSETTAYGCSVKY